MEQDINQIIVTEASLQRRNLELAAQLSSDYTGRDLTVVMVSNGAFMFAADLLRLIPLPLQLDSIGVSSYIGVSSEELHLRSDLKTDLRNRHVLVIDDIFDTGRTLNAVMRHLRRSQPISLRACVLLIKDVPRATDLRPDYWGFRINDEFIVGYGLDLNEKYRNLPYLAVLRSEAVRRILGVAVS